MLRFDRKQQNSIKQLSFNKKMKKGVKNKARINTFWRNPPSIQISKNFQIVHRRKKFTKHTEKDVTIKGSRNKRPQN